MPEKNLLDSAYHYVIDASGEYVTVTDATHAPLSTQNSPLTSKDRHILARSTGATVIARSTGHDVFSRGGTQPLSTPNPPLFTRN